MSTDITPVLLDDLGPVVSDSIKRFVAFAAGQVLGHIGNWRNKEKQLRTGLERQLLEAGRWSSRVQFFGMASGLATSSATVGLQIALEPRRFRKSRTSKIIHESLLLKAASPHQLLLGDPGSGKTTTLKRLVNKLLTSSTEQSASPFRYPIVVRLREFNNVTSLDRHLADVFAITYVFDEKRKRHYVDATSN